MPKYTVRQATPTGKSDPTYGTEYIVHFNEDDREVRLSKKDAVVVGQEFNGTINSNKYGCYFKKDPFVPGQATAPAATTSPQPTAKPSRTFKDNSDGMRQGMCINNAANYVNKILGVDEPLDAAAWAKAVHAHATALYRLGDLTQDPDVQNVKDVFDAAA
jgi:hypothetical protein